MLRFQPDSIVEGLLRPLAMMDPAGHVYVELLAPDWRLATFFLMLLVAGVAARGRMPWTVGQARLVLAFIVCLLTWTFAVGNGRYFLAWLLVVGPLVVLVSRWLPGTRGFRATVLGVVFVVQAFVLHQTYMPNPWDWARWVDGPAVDLEPSVARDAPATFVTVSSISYSILIPKFHPQSRWINIAGQRDLTPDMPEYPRAVSVLEGGLPLYLVSPVIGAGATAEGQPGPEMGAFFAEALSPMGLSLGAGPCHVLQSSLARGWLNISVAGQGPTFNAAGFWICPLAYSKASRLVTSSAPQVDGATLQVLGAVEARCPRLFPGKDRFIRQRGAITSIHYPSTDYKILIDGTGQIFYRPYRTIGPVRLGAADDVKAGRFVLDCTKTPGRYRLPWDV